MFKMKTTTKQKLGRVGGGFFAEGGIYFRIKKSVFVRAQILPLKSSLFWKEKNEVRKQKTGRPTKR